MRTVGADTQVVVREFRGTSIPNKRVCALLSCVLALDDPLLMFKARDIPLERYSGEAYRPPSHLTPHGVPPFHLYHTGEDNDLAQLMEVSLVLSGAGF